MTQGIYKINNTVVSNAYYLGSSMDIDDRWTVHRWALRNNRHENSRLQRAWNKYGESAFSFEIIEVFVGTLHELLLREDEYLEKLPETCYNIRRSSYKIQPYDAITREKISYGVKEHWRKNRKRLIESLTRSRQSDEYKHKMSESCRSVWTEEMKEQMSHDRTGTKNSMTDRTIYTLENALTSETFTGMKCDFLRMYPTLNYTGLKKLLDGKWKKYRGWKRITSKIAEQTQS